MKHSDLESGNVTVWLVTYNHEKYIEQCLNGVACQTLLERISVLWFDDCSTDNTVELATDILGKLGIPYSRYPNPFNFASKKIKKTPFMFHNTRSEFIAVLEGDDFWLDQRKIEMQAAALEDSPDVDITYSKSGSCDSDGNALKEVWGDTGDTRRIIRVEDVIKGDGGFMPTSTLFLRTSAFLACPSLIWQHTVVGDYILQVYLSLRGGALYIPTTTSCYRMGDGSGWTACTMGDPDSRRRFHGDFIRHLADLDQSLGGRFHNEFQHVKRGHLRQLMHLSLQDDKFDVLRDVLGGY
jgi:hypothetical protein